MFSVALTSCGSMKYSNPGKAKYTKHHGISLSKQGAVEKNDSDKAQGRLEKNSESTTDQLIERNTKTANDASFVGPLVITLLVGFLIGYLAIMVSIEVALLTLAAIGLSVLSGILFGDPFWILEIIINILLCF